MPVMLKLADKALNGHACRVERQGTQVALHSLAQDDEVVAMWAVHRAFLHVLPDSAWYSTAVFSCRACLAA